VDAMENSISTEKLCVCDGGCIEPTVVSLQISGSDRAQDLTKGFVFKKLCGKCSVAAARLVLLDSALTEQLSLEFTEW
jgi:hypothetical protein